jgi:hypothetical protein
MLAVESYVKDISHKVDELQRQNEKYHLTSQDWAAQEREVIMDGEKAKLRSEVLAWVSRVDYRANLTSALRHMLPSNSAGDWYLQSQAFRDWLDLEEQQGILLTGSCTLSVLDTLKVSFPQEPRSWRGEDCALWQIHSVFEDQGLGNRGKTTGHLLLL